MRLISTLLTFMAMASPFVSAAVQSDFDTTGHAGTPAGATQIAVEFDDFLILDKFDPSLGSLTQITLTLTGDVTSTVTISNINAGSLNSKGTANVDIFVTSNLQALNQDDNILSITASSTTAVSVPGCITFSGPTCTSPGQAVAGPFNKNGVSNFIQVAYTGAHSQTDFVNPIGSLDPGFTALQTIPLRLFSSSFVGATGGAGLSSTGTTLVKLVGTIDYTYTATVTGDPQFAGFQGQQFQFHGLPDTVFNLVSSPELQMNSQFVYIASGICNYNNTACFSHAGTYLGQIGVAIGSQTFTIVSGPHSKGLRAFVQTGSDRHAMVVGAKFSFTTAHGEMSISHPDNSHVEIRSPNFLFNIINSDSFFNLEASLLNTQLLHTGAKRHNIKHCKDSVATEASLMKHYPVKNYIHGLVGQTWRAVTFCDQPYQGVVGDYIASDLHSNDYRYNFFNATE